MPILVNKMTLQVFTWGALSNQLGIALELREDGGDNPPSYDPVDLLEKIDTLSSKYKHFRVSGISAETLGESGEELFALGRAAANRGMMVSVVHLNVHYEPWFAQVPYKIQVLFPGGRLSTECQEIWYMVQSSDDPDPVIPPVAHPPLNFARFNQDMTKDERIDWIEKSSLNWGYLYENAPGLDLRSLL